MSNTYLRKLWMTLTEHWDQVVLPGPTDGDMMYLFELQLPALLCPSWFMPKLAQ